MKANIVKELQAGMKKRKAENATNPIVQEVNRLLEYDAARDNQVLDMIAPQSSLSQSKNEMAAIMELEAAEDFMSGEIFTKQQIINIGVKYRLKFLSSSYYKKYIDPKIVVDIRELERHISTSMTKEQAAKRNTTVENYIIENGEIKFQFDEHQLKSKFYILAPASCFKTEKTAAFKTHVSDPIMFYTADGVHFRVIRKWGSDFTVFRMLLGWLTRSNTKHVVRLYIMPLIILSIAISAFITWFVMLPVLIVLAIVGLVFGISGSGPIDFDSTFAGEGYVTSTKSFYI